MLGFSYLLLSVLRAWEKSVFIAQLMKETKIRTGGWRRKIQTDPIVPTSV